MKNVEDMSLKELKEQKDIVASLISDRLTVEKFLGCDTDYRQETRAIQSYLTSIIKGIDARYDEITSVSSLGYEFMENINDREKDKLILNDDGEMVIELFKTNVKPFDENLINGGFKYSSLIGIGGETNAGKSDIVYMIVDGALSQGLKVHFHNYELSKTDIFVNVHMKKKIKIDFEDQINHNMLSVDNLASELTDLKRMINIRADDGCRIFVIDSFTKIKINGNLIKDNKEVDEAMETLRFLAHSRNLIIIFLGQKDKASKMSNENELIGSVQQGHIVDYLFFVNFEDRENRMTDEREIVMVKNRGQDTKKSIITGYDSATHSIY
jgi:archaellum biogenesis ATPase FlaH